MRDCANCFHRKPVLKEDGTWTAECEKWDCEFQSRENMIEKTEAKEGDLISRSALKKKFDDYIKANPNVSGVFELGKFIIDNAPTVHGIVAYVERPKGEWQPDMDSFYCDQCGVTALEINRKWYKSNFCPNCGADMRGEKE